MSKKRIMTSIHKKRAKMSRQLLGILVTGVFVFGLVLAVHADDSAKSGIDTLLESLKKQVDANTDGSDKLKVFVKETLIPYCADPVFVRETATQNGKKVALDEIKKIDREWIDAEDEIPIHKEKLNNACAEELKAIVANYPVIVEAFVMDNQGAVVGENSLTSDYWQGDEDKWTNSFNNGKGGVDIGKSKFDKSANAVLQQVSLPIIDENGVVIGVVTYGISVDNL